MANLNKVLLIGNLTRDPEILWTSKGTAVCKGGMAINRNWRGQDGQRQEETCFVDFSMFGKKAETFHQYMRKGRPVFIEGRLQFDSWEGQDGQRRNKLKVVAENFQFIGGRQDGPDAGGGQQAAAPARSQGAPARSQGAPERQAPPQRPSSGWNKPSGPPSQPPSHNERYDDLVDDDIPF